MKTHIPKDKDIKRKWFLFDADGKVLGRLATRVATVLRGKSKADFTPHIDGGDGAIVINASKVAVTGRKMQNKLYTNYSGYPGGLRTRNLEEVLKRKPTEVIKHAVKGMLPKNTLGAQMLKRLKVYTGAEHAQTAQKPMKVEI